MQRKNNIELEQVLKVGALVNIGALELFDLERTGLFNTKKQLFIYTNTENLILVRKVNDRMYKIIEVHNRDYTKERT